jgi:hypothetical protein
MTLTGMLATAYAPTSIFPHAGMAFGMERETRREMAREELGRRWTQTGRAGAHRIAHGFTLGLSSYAMRRTGIEASYLTEMETERTLQNQMGVLRGEGGYEAVSGRGVRRDFFREGPGKAAMTEIQRRAGGLQAEYGYGVEQMNMMTRMAAGSIDVTRYQQAAAGGRGGMRNLGREISDIRDTGAAMAREMQMSEKEIQEFFSRLKGVMKITGESVREFQQENRRLSAQGPFSQKQVAGMRMQFTQMGRQMYMGGMDFGTEAMEQANRVAELRRGGVISAETLLREGGGLDPQAMARMIAARLQQQAGLVQGGNFNQALTLAGQNPEAYAGMMGGAGFMQTQAALGTTMARNPFALLQAQLDPQAVRRVTMQAPAIAFQRAQQMGELFVAGNEEQRRAQMIRKFGQQMGFDIRTPQGLGQAKTRYEELEIQREMIETDLADRFTDPRTGAPTRTPAQLGEMSASLMGIMTETGETASTMAGVMTSITNDTDLQRKWSTGSAAGRSRLVREVLAEERATDMYNEAVAMGGTVSKAFEGRGGTKGGIRKARAWARSLEKKGATSDEINKAVFGDLSSWNMKAGDLDEKLWITMDEKGERVSKIEGRAGETADLEMRRLVHVGGGKMKLETKRMSMTYKNLRDELRAAGDVSKEEFMEHLMGLGGRRIIKKGTTEALDSDSIDDQMLMDWQDQLASSGERLSVESIKQAGMARDEWSRARRKGAGVFDILKRRGLEVDEDVTRGLGELLDVDVQDKKKFAEIRRDPRMKPLVQAIEQFSGRGIETRKEFMSMTGIIGQDNMRSFFKEYASSEEGAKRLGGKSFQEFLGRRPLERMNELFQGMSGGEKQAFMVRTLSSAIEKSQRLVNEAKLGESESNAMHVKLSKEQLEAIKG